MKKISLNGEYRLYTYDYTKAPQKPDQLTGAYICAQVPGNVELDYWRAGLLPDMLVATNARQAQELELKDFWYTRDFILEDPDVQAELCFEGVDTLADYYLNGEELGSSDNMLVPHTFPVARGLLRRGTNTLAVHIRSSVAHAKDYNIEPYCVAFPGCYENLHIRKSAMNYGWDISPRLVSAGIWRDVSLQIREKNEFRDVYLATTGLYPDLAILQVCCNVTLEDQYLGRCKLRVSGVCGDSRFQMEYLLPHCSASVYPYVYSPKLWHVRGTGEQNLYDITLEVLYEDTVLATYCTRFGIRTVKLVYGEKTGPEGQFHFLVNGKPVRCRGVNWVPLSLLHSQDPEFCQSTVEALRDSNSNMVRVWGGGVYESDTFFDLCDAYGILVWQDMMLSCHAYPSTDQMCKAIAAECEAVAKRLRNHPSLAIYCGGNETDWPYVSVGLDPNDDILSRTIMKQTLYRFDPFRTLLPSTPYHSREAIEKYGGRFYVDLEDIKNARTELPDEHYWWHREDYRNVREQTHKFISEIGYSGGSELDSVERYLPAGWSFNDDATWEDHSYPTEGSRQTGIEYLFDEIPESDADKLIASQYYQAEAYKFVVELSRSREYNYGILLWTLRENWPSFSSALVDYYGKRKIAFDVVKTSFEPLQCVVDVQNGQATCFLLNDRMDEQNVTVCITDENGQKLCTQQVQTKPDCSVYRLCEFSTQGHSLLLTSVTAGKETVKNYCFTSERKLHYPTYRALFDSIVKGVL